MDDIRYFIVERVIRGGWIDTIQKAHWFDENGKSICGHACETIFGTTVKRSRCRLCERMNWPDRPATWIEREV